MKPPNCDDALTIARHGEVLVVSPSPALRSIDTAHADATATLILDALDGIKAPLVVVDLTHLPVFGTAFLALLIRCWKRISNRGGTLALAGSSPDVLNLLKITRFDTIWPLYDSVPEAIAALIDD
ncbi:MAG: hypothetical protein KatS3mg108_3101 [Isosphaeraceae bacterium]|jgi:anti-anti-sigma factor|nr:MAG: hypothetical protein KatS3mg108_3101 [Isosphaeraceae bacterium]